jgi:hypothetical protein
MTVYVIVNNQTDAITGRRIFSTREAALNGLLQLVPWIATEATVQEKFRIDMIEVEEQG